MKVTFSGLYSDLIRRINSPISKKGEMPNDGFDALLGDLEPARSYLTVNNEEIKGSMKAQTALGSGVGSLKKLSHAPEFPAPEPLPSSPLRVREVESVGVEGDRSLTLLEAKRVRRHKAYVKPVERGEVKQLIKDYGRKMGVDPSLALAVAMKESALNPTAVSKDGHESKGLFQLLDSTGRGQMKRLGIKGKYDPFDPAQNTALGISYLRYLHDLFSSQVMLPNGAVTVPAANSSSLEKLAVAAFNAGEGTVALAQQRAAASGYNPSQWEDVSRYLPELTRKYVEDVFSVRRAYEGMEGEFVV